MAQVGGLVGGVGELVARASGLVGEVSGLMAGVNALVAKVIGLIAAKGSSEFGVDILAKVIGAQSRVWLTYF